MPPQVAPGAAEHTAGRRSLYSKAWSQTPSKTDSAPIAHAETVRRRSHGLLELTAGWRRSDHVARDDLVPAANTAPRVRPDEIRHDDRPCYVVVESRRHGPA